MVQSHLFLFLALSLLASPALSFLTSQAHETTMARGEGDTRMFSGNATPLLSDDSSYSGITFRAYEPQDFDQVRTLFVKGMQTIVPLTFRCAATSRLFLLPYSIWTAAASGWIATRFFTKTTRMAASMTALVVAATFPLIGLWYSAWRGHTVYIAWSLDDDLRDIEQVYGADKEGVFVVAVNDKTNQVIGMVGGENKSATKGSGVYELRRMSVAASAQQRGLGQRLVSELERRLKQQYKLRKLYLTTLSTMWPAQSLYVGAGFSLTKTIPLQERNWIFRNLVTIHKYEKEYHS